MSYRSWLYCVRDHSYATPAVFRGDSTPKPDAWMKFENFGGICMKLWKRGECQEQGVVRRTKNVQMSWTSCVSGPGRPLLLSGFGQPPFALSLNADVICTCCLRRRRWPPKNRKIGEKLLPARSQIAGLPFPPFLPPESRSLSSLPRPKSRQCGVIFRRMCRGLYLVGRPHGQASLT